MIGNKKSEIERRRKELGEFFDETDQEEGFENVINEIDGNDEDERQPLIQPEEGEQSLKAPKGPAKNSLKRRKEQQKLKKSPAEISQPDKKNEVEPAKKKKRANEKQRLAL